MKRNQHFIWLPLFLLFTININAQCPPSTLSLQNQTDVDVFASNYPNCTEINGTLFIGGSVENLTSLDAIEKVAGDLLFDNSNTLTDISGLNQLDSIGGNFFINNNNSLMAISGFEALSSVNGSIIILNNANLASISGFGNLADIGTLEITTNADLQSITGFGQLATVGSLEVKNHPSLSDISGLENLVSVTGNFLLENNSGLTEIALNSLTNVGERLSISQNDNLLTINGLQDLIQVGELYITVNNTLTTMGGLGQLSSIDSNLNILGNLLLTDISALDHPVMIGASVFLISNSELSACSIDAICNHISVGGSTNAQNNAPGCSSTTEIVANCTLTCPAGDIVFNSQADVVTYVTTYPNCTLLAGNLSIGPLSGGTSDITDVSGLSNLLEVQGNLSIQNNSDLTTILGLNEITTVGGDFSIINNNSLINTESLQQFSSVGSSIRIDDNPQLIDLAGLSQIVNIPSELSVISNNALQNLNGLSALSSTNNITILDNQALNDLTAFDHVINITGLLTIENNPLLSMCGVQAICEHVMMSGDAEISNNAPNCNSKEQVTVICTVSIADALSADDITVFPNPSAGIFTISGMDRAAEIVVYDALGQMVYFDTTNNNTIDISVFAAGIYYLIIKTQEGNIHKKLLVE